MAATTSLVSYDSDSSNEEIGSKDLPDDNENTVDNTVVITALKSKILLNSAPAVTAKEDIGTVIHLDPTEKEVTFNPKYEQLFAPAVGPQNPFKTKQQKAQKNTLSGFVAPAHMSKFQFDNQMKTFSSYGYALDPSDDTAHIEEKFVGDLEKAKESKGLTVFEASKPRAGDKRKREDRGDPGVIEGYKGPWSKFADEEAIAKPSEEESSKLEEYELTKKNKTKKEDDKPVEEKSTLHVKDAYDYQGRSYLHIPQDIGINLKTDEPPERCFLPKRHIHTWSGHTKGVSAIRFFPRSAHLLLSCSMDCKIKLWEVYGDRRLLRTFNGHSKAVRDICFNNDGSTFLSAAYDRYCKLWDSETGQCVGRFTNRKVPYCVKFNPDEDKQHLFVCGTSDKKILTWDTRANEIVQEYDRHLGAVNQIAFVDQNKKFVSTSDDKSVRIWEWDIPVDAKYIAEPSMHSMPSITVHPN
ncbi:pre-mRNA-processing factor 17, partial [Paramuricea clavata]